MKSQFGYRSHKDKEYKEISIDSMFLCDPGVFVGYAGKLCRTRFYIGHTGRYFAIPCALMGIY
jgi:hypothetical protein